MDSSLDIKNGLLSFSNPNYKLLEGNDLNNCNNNKEEEAEDDEEEELLSDECDFDDSLYQEIEISPICRLNRKPSVRNRRNYAQLNIGSMGVDLTSDPLTSAIEQQNPLLLNSSTTNTTTVEADIEIVNSQKNQCDADNNLNQETATEETEVVNDNEVDDNMVGRKVNKYNNKTEIKACDAQDLKIREEMCRSLTDMAMTPDSCCSSNGTSITVITDGIPHIPGQVNNDLYAVPVKCKSPQTACKDGKSTKSPVCDDLTSTTMLQSVGSSSKSSVDQSSHSDTPQDPLLPHGWEKHEDIDGPYFWHIKSGTIQREPPKLPLSVSQQDIRQLQPPPSDQPQSSVSNSVLAVASSKNETSLDEMVKKRHSCPPSSITPIHSNEKGEKYIRFAVRSLGWVEIAEEDLTPDRSSKAVNKCIVDLSLGRNDKLDAVGRWGDGKDLYMDLDDHSLKLVSPLDMKVLNTQRIHTIRVWGVGRDNGRDFAYVARDRMSRKHMCHVFRCDTPARTIANTLRDICKKIMIERSLVQGLARPVDTGPTKNQRNVAESKLVGVHRSHPLASGRGNNGPIRPNNLPVDHKLGDTRSFFPAPHSFPTPMEEPKKVLKAHYLGMEKVKKPTGMEVLNEAIDKKMNSVPPDKWQAVNVAVAPSTISIQESKENGKLLCECRVRFLSFLGIGKNIKNCAFIMHTAQDEFIAYVFHCEPSSGAICKTVEAACKLRYQKCLDSHHPQSAERHTSENESKSIGSTIRNMLGTLTGKKSRSMDS